MSSEIVYDLEPRTFEFAARVRRWVRTTKKTVTTYDDLKQVIRSSGSVGANYIEAQEAISPKDFALRIKICRKEARESHYWLRLLAENIDEEQPELLLLIQESLELAKIFGSIVKRKLELLANDARA
jgi:four helix bundle protein